jgi:hypothetical protein
MRRRDFIEGIAGSERMVAMIKRVYNNAIAGPEGITAKVPLHTARLAARSDNTGG